MQGPAGQALAESIVLRGARRGGAPLQSYQAADLLDQSLLLEGTALLNHWLQIMGSGETVSTSAASCGPCICLSGFTFAHFTVRVSLYTGIESCIVWGRKCDLH